MVVNQLNGKFVIMGTGIATGTFLSPMNFMLIQQ